MDRGVVATDIAQIAYRGKTTFDAERITATCTAAHAAALVGGHAALWVAGDLSWTARHPAVCEDLARHEREIGAALADPTLTRVCLYDASRFAEPLLQDVAREHAITVRL
jgi:hypothetical protein